MALPIRSSSKGSSGSPERVRQEGLSVWQGVGTAHPDVWTDCGQGELPWGHSRARSPAHLQGGGQISGGPVCCDGGLRGGSTESPQPCWGLERGEQLQGAWTRGPQPQPSFACVQSREFPYFFPSASSRTFCTVTFIPTQGGAPTAAAERHRRTPLPTGAGTRPRPSARGYGSAARAVGTQRGQKHGVWTLPQHPRAAGSVHSERVKHPCQPPSMSPGQGRVPKPPATPGIGEWVPRQPPLPTLLPAPGAGTSSRRQGRAVVPALRCLRAGVSTDGRFRGAQHRAASGPGCCDCSGR